MATTVRGIVWTDSAGRTRLTTPRAAGSLSSIQAALLAKSNAVINYYWEGTQVAGSGVGVTATYPSVVDTAQLIFEDAACDQVRLMLVAPQLGIFLADGDTVDPAQVAGIITACLGNLQTAAGGVVTGYIAGYRNRKV